MFTIIENPHTPGSAAWRAINSRNLLAASMNAVVGSYRKKAYHNAAELAVAMRIGKRS